MTHEILTRGPAWRHWVLVAALAWSGALPAHEGHDHAEAASLPTVPAGPRFAAASADLELVGSLDGETLVLYLDRYASNEPVTDARVEVESGDWKAVATPRADGAYATPAGPLAAVGSHPVVVSVESPALADLLQAQLVVLPPPPADTGVADERALHARHYATGTLAGLALAGLAVWVMKRRGAA